MIPTLKARRRGSREENKGFKRGIFQYGYILNHGESGEDGGKASDGFVNFKSFLTP